MSLHSARSGTSSQDNPIYISSMTTINRSGTIYLFPSVGDITPIMMFTEKNLSRPFFIEFTGDIFKAYDLTIA